MKLLGFEPIIEALPDAIDYVVNLSNGKKIVVKDGFFNNFPNNLTYLSIDNIPDNGGKLKALNTECHYIFGENSFTVEKDVITIGADLFASAFFVLSRWEEFLRGRETKGDCDEMELFVVKSGFYKYPIVNEYEFLLRECFGRLGENIVCNRKFNIKYTLDVDNYLQVTWGGVWRFTKQCIQKRKIKSAINCVINNSLIKVYTANKTQLFKKHLSIANKYGLNVEFYMKCCNTDDVGATYMWNDGCLNSIIRLLEEKGGVIGFHPSESTINNNAQFEKELKRYRLQYKIGTDSARNHTLLFNTNSYYQWIKGGFSHISNGGFHRINGFRCGIGGTFPVFDIYKREELALREEPFHIMDVAVMKSYLKMMDSWEDIKEVIDNAKRYNCTLLLNWHIIVFFSLRTMLDSFELVNKVLKYSYDM